MSHVSVRVHEAILLFPLIVLVTNPIFGRNIPHQYLAPPGASNIFNTSIQNQLNITIFPGRTQLSKSEILKINHLKLKQQWYISLYQNHLFLYLCALIEQCPTKINAIIQQLDNQVTYDSFTGMQMRSLIASLVLRLKILAIIEHRIIEEENHTAENISFSDFTNPLYWIFVEGFSRSDANYAVTLIKPLSDLFKTDPSDKMKSIDMLPVDRLRYYSLVISNGNIINLDVTNLIETYATEPKLIIYRMLNKISRLSDSRIRQLLFDFNLFTPNGFVDCLNTYKINCSASPKKLVAEYNKIYVMLSQRYPQGENIFTESPHLMVDAFIAFIEKKEWRTVLDMKPQISFYQFERPLADLTLFLKHTVKTHIPLPASDWVRDWRESKIFDSLANAEIIHPDLLYNDERLGFMLKLYASYYRKFRELYPHKSHNAIVVHIARKLKIIQTIPDVGTVSHQPSASSQIPYTPSDIAQATKEIIEHLNPRLKKQIILLSYLKYAFRCLYYKRFLNIDETLINGPVFIEKCPISSISNAEIQESILVSLEQSLHNNDEVLLDFNYELLKYLIVINQQLPHEDKFNPYVDQDIIPYYSRISYISKEQWDVLTQKYLHRTQSSSIAPNEDTDVSKSH